MVCWYIKHVLERISHPHLGGSKKRKEDLGLHEGHNESSFSKKYPVEEHIGTSYVHVSILVKSKLDYKDKKPCIAAENFQHQGDFFLSAVRLQSNSKEDWCILKEDCAKILRL